MKIMVTVVELDVDKWNAKGPPYRKVDPANRFSASWAPAGGARIYSNHCASKEAALDSLRDYVRRYFERETAKTIEDLEIEL